MGSNRTDTTSHTKDLFAGDTDTDNSPPPMKAIMAPQDTIAQEPEQGRQEPEPNEAREEPK